MLTQNLVLIAAIAAPVVILFLLRANAAIVFLSLCAGSVLVQFVGNDASFLGSLIGNNAKNSSQYFELALLFLPVVLSTILLRKSMKGPKSIINLLPALAVGVVGVILAVPLLPYGAQQAVTNCAGWRVLNDNKEIVVAAGVLVSLIVLWISNASSKKDKDKKKKHH